MSENMGQASVSELKEHKRAVLFSEALGYIRNLKSQVSQRMVGNDDFETNASSSFTLKDNYSLDRSDINNYEKLSVQSILMQRGIESLDKMSDDRFDPSVRELIKQKSSEVGLLNDLAFFFLNHNEEFVKFCNETLSNNFNPENFGDDFLHGLEGYYHKSSNFTNTFLSFYLANIDKLEYIVETGLKTKDFIGSTDLLSVRQSNVLYLESGKVRAFEDAVDSADSKIFTVNLKSSVDKILEYMFLDDSLRNPFRVRINGMNYYRDLKNSFTTYAHFEDLLRNQLVENILNQFKFLFIGYHGDIAHFVLRKNNEKDAFTSKTIEFKVYGIDFTNEINLK